MDDTSHPFRAEALEHAVNAALVDVPPAHDGAAVTISTAQGAQVVIAHKFNDHWSVLGAASHPLGKGKLDYGVAVKGSWAW